MIKNLLQPSENLPETLARDVQIADFWNIPPQERAELLLAAIIATHAWHYPRNKAYRCTVEGRGIGAQVGKADLARLLRPTAQTFKSYIEIMGTPFPQDRPAEFLEWMADQLSVELPRQRFAQFKGRYMFLEEILADIERIFSDFGFEVSTSSGTSGRSTIMLRDRLSIDRTVESFYLAFQRYFGLRVDHRAIFIMPATTRIAMARMARFSVRRIGLPENRVHFTIPFPAFPDQVRVRAGRTYKEGWEGIFEKRFQHCFMNWANDHVVTPNTIREVIRLLERAEEEGDKILLFGGWVHLHMLANQLMLRKRVIHLPEGSVLGTGGGFKERYPFTPPHIRQDLHETICLPDGSHLPFRDCYGMAEGNWAAMQCKAGNYHIAPWIYAVALDDDNCIIEKEDATGLLAFFDPFCGGRLFPPFFKTSDRVRLINGFGRGAACYNPALNCACGEAGAYLTQGSIQRVDLMDEAGCAAQL